MTLFSQAQYKFPVIEQCEDIPTDPFLLAADEIVPFFGMFNKILWNSAYVIPIPHE